jgi:regulator of protease activity HflC (stomatin/prohibitin superfamily)
LFYFLYGLASGLYRVLPDEQGVVLRFGKFIKTTQPGLNYHIPFPVETVETPKVTKLIEWILDLDLKEIVDFLQAEV